MAAVVLLSGCKTKYVTVEKVRTEYAHSTDTVHITDTVKEKETSILQIVDSAYLKGIGILNPPQKAYLLEKSHNKQEKNTLIEHHTDTIVKCDSVPVPYPVPEYIEKKLSWFQTFRLWLGNIVLALVGGGCAYWLLGRIKL